MTMGEASIGVMPNDLLPPPSPVGEEEGHWGSDSQVARAASPPALLDPGGEHGQSKAVFHAPRADSPSADSDAAGAVGLSLLAARGADATAPAAVLESDGGHTSRDPQSPIAPAQPVQVARNGHAQSARQHRCADLAILHAQLGHYARLYWDLQTVRIAVGNRGAAMERDGIAPIYQGVPLGPKAQATVSIPEIAGGLETLEHQVVLTLQRLVRQHFMRDWVEAQRGLGLLGFAGLVGVTGDLSRFPSVAKLWKYLGLHVQDGHAPRREKGVPWTHTDCQGGHLASCKPACTTDHHAACVPGGVGTAYAPKGRVLCHQLGEAIVKVGGSGPYRAAYDRKKAEYEAGRPDWTQARRHNAAMRYAVKLLIKEMWIEWRYCVRARAG